MSNKNSSIYPRMFPILKSNPPAFIAWEIVAEHEVQAVWNHYQDLETLARRGGLSWLEMYAVLYDKTWLMIEKEKLTEHEAEEKVHEFVKNWCSKPHKEDNNDIKTD